MTEVATTLIRNRDIVSPIDTAWDLDDWERSDKRTRLWNKADQCPFIPLWIAATDTVRCLELLMMSQQGGGVRMNCEGLLNEAWSIQSNDGSVSVGSVV